VLIARLPASLTDDAIRENLRLYGNPDGVQQREEKIAIPKWVVEGKNGLWVLAVYGLSLGGGIPFLVVSTPCWLAATYSGNG
jgi:translocation protein SEC63